MSESAPNLLKPEWAAIDSDDLRTILASRYGEPGQTTGLGGDLGFYLPLAGPTCCVILYFEGNRIRRVAPGVAFDQQQWDTQVAAPIETLLTASAEKVGRDIAFAGARVRGSWRGDRSGVQIGPLPADAPVAPYEMALHPFLLEVPLHSDLDWNVTNLRRRREVRRYALLLNALLRGGVQCEARQIAKAWAVLPHGSSDAAFRCAYLQLSYFADVGEVVTNDYSRPSPEALSAFSPEDYYERIGLDGTGLAVPADLDDTICSYRDLPANQREKFDCALYWLDIASRQWEISMSASFASLVSAIEALTVRGVEHGVHCDRCGRIRSHHEPGPTALFKNFFEDYAPGASRRGDRDLMYKLRSKISHGSGLMAFDEGRGYGWDPPLHDQSELHRQLWALTRVALRNYLGRFATTTKAPGSTVSC